MTFRVRTRDGTVVIVAEADLEWITAYLVLRGYPPVKVEAADAAPEDPCETVCERLWRAGR